MRFGVFEIDLNAGELRKNGVKMKLDGQPFQILVMLAERSEEVVKRKELYAALWPTDPPDDLDHGLNNSVMKLRDVLGDSSETPSFIETLPRRGYRFRAHVEITSACQQGATTDDQKNDHTEALGEIRQSLLMANSVSDLRKLHIRLETALDQYREHPALNEALELLYEIRSALENETVSSSLGGIATARVAKISPQTAACVFDDEASLTRYCGFGSWVTLGNVIGQTIVVDHTVEQRNGREIVRIISSRKATPAERRIYEQKRS
jgi:DNA-binding winged helix-turn-helix (wHTH) protein/uncharacterized DUF497 family protein